MTSAQVVANNSSFQNYHYPDDHTTQTVYLLLTKYEQKLNPGGVYCI